MAGARVISARRWIFARQSALTESCFGIEEKSRNRPMANELSYENTKAKVLTLTTADEQFPVEILKRKNQDEAGSAILKPLSISNHVSGSTQQKKDRCSNNPSATRPHPRRPHGSWNWVPCRLDLAISPAAWESPSRREPACNDHNYFSSIIVVYTENVFSFSRFHAIQTITSFF